MISNIMELVVTHIYSSLQNGNPFALVPCYNIEDDEQTQTESWNHVMKGAIEFGYTPIKAETGIPEFSDGTGNVQDQQELLLAFEMTLSHAAELGKQIRQPYVAVNDKFGFSIVNTSTQSVDGLVRDAVTESKDQLLLTMGLFDALTVLRQGRIDGKALHESGRVAIAEPDIRLRIDPAPTLALLNGAVAVGA